MEMTNTTLTCEQQSDTHKHTAEERNVKREAETAASASASASGCADLNMEHILVTSSTQRCGAVSRGACFCVVLCCVPVLCCCVLCVVLCMHMRLPLIATVWLVVHLLPAWLRAMGWTRQRRQQPWPEEGEEGGGGDYHAAHAHALMDIMMANKHTCNCTHSSNTRTARCWLLHVCISYR